MLQDLYTYSMQPYLLVWSVLFALFAVLALISIFSGFDLDMDLDADVDLDVGGEVTGGVFKSLFIYLNAGTMPITLVIFSLVSINWAGGICLNEFLNSDHNLIWGFGIQIALLFVSIPVTKVVTYPVKELFKMLNEDQEALDQAVGSICHVETEVNSSHGRAIIDTGTSPLNIMVKCEEGNKISKGSKAVVLEFDKKLKRYLIAEIEDDIFNNQEK